MSPTIVKGVFRGNVIPSEAEANLDVYVAPGEDLPAFVEMLRKVANEPGVEIVPPQRLSRVVAPPSRIDTGMFRAIEAAQRKSYPGAITIPTMSTGATDKVFLQAKGVTTYGFGPVVVDEEDAEKDSARIRTRNGCERRNCTVSRGSIGAGAGDRSPLAYFGHKEVLKPSKTL